MPHGLGREESTLILENRKMRRTLEDHARCPFLLKPFDPIRRAIEVRAERLLEFEK